MNIRATVPGEKFEQVKKGAQKTNGVTVLITKKASAIKPKAIRWMWPDRFALGKLGLIGGMPDKGKGLITCDLIACITSGHPLPCEEGNTPHGSVLYFTAEDDYNDTVVPRLMAAGANLDKVDIVQMMDDSGNPRMFNMVTDLAALKTKIEEIGDVIMVVIDPMSAYQGHGKINQASTSDIRSFLCPLTDMASELRVFILGIMHFNKKADITNAMLRIADSLAYVAAARHVYVVVDDTENEGHRLFVKPKNNLPTDKKALRYTTGSKLVGKDEEDDKEIWAPYLIWGQDHVEITATEAMQAESGGGNKRSSEELDEATDFLRTELCMGAKPSTEIDESAKAAGITVATLRRAKKKLKIKSVKEKGVLGGGWAIRLPTEEEEREF